MWKGRIFISRASSILDFPKTLEETLEKWQGVELEDMVRTIRMLRPQIVVNGWGGQKTGHGNHQDSGYQTPKAVEAAADPTKYPDQIAEGLKPWRVEDDSESGARDRAG